MIANLGFETELAEAPGRVLGREAILAAARAGSVMRVLAQSGDTIWLPGPPDLLRLAPLPGLPTPDLVYGPLPRWFDGPVLAWGETATTSCLGTGTARLVTDDSPVLAALHAWGRPDPAPARLVNGKRLLLPLRKDLGCTLPGSGLVRSVEELVRLVKTCRRIHGDGAGWVLKGNYSAAGRERVVERPGTAPDGTVHERAERLLRRHGPCLFEPWFERIADFGCSLLIGERQTRLAGVHRLLLTPSGRFQGVETVLNGKPEPEAIDPVPFERYLSQGEAVRMARVAAGAASALSGFGYQGPAGIDFWRYVDRSGAERIHPLGEVNARLTFGLLARVLAQRAGHALGCPPETVFRLRFGRGAGSCSGKRFPLVFDRDKNSALAWFEMENPAI